MSSEKASTSTLFEALPDEAIEGSAEIEEPSPLQELSELSSLQRRVTSPSLSLAPFALFVS